jgi:hypothetical protein
MKWSFVTLLKYFKYAWMPPAAMVVALVIPDNFLIFKFFAVILAMALFYSTISSANFIKGISK